MQKVNLTLEFSEDCPEEVLKLISNMIVIKPQKRFSIEQVLESPLFAEIRNECLASKLRKPKNSKSSKTPFDEYQSKGQ